MKIQPNPRARRQAGYSALFITLVLVGASVVVLGATLSRSMTSSKLNDRNTQFIASGGAAEAAVEKALAAMMVDFENSGEALVIANTNYYATNYLPTAAENPYWTNFVFSDGQGNANHIYVARISTGTNANYVQLAEQYSGLSGYSSTYRVLANVSSLNSSYSYNFTNAVQQDVQLAQIPVFQFAIFYNTLLEFSDTATLNVTGPVHSNTNIYVGSPANLTFNSIVTDSGNISSPANAGYGTGSWTGTVAYHGAPSPGFINGAPTLNLPIGTNSQSATNVQQILYPPPAGELPTSAMGQQRYYNKAHMVLIVSNGFFWATFKSAPNDGAPVTFYTNLTWLTSTNADATNWNWLTTTASFTDRRENKTVNLTQIDVGKLTNWMGTSGWLMNQALNHTNGVSSKYSPANPFNIIYVADYRTSGSTLFAVRLMDGANLPTAGLTVATPNPAYVWDVYNCPNPLFKDGTNTTASAPASIVCDALTILSHNWSDLYSTLNVMGETISVNDTVNAAFIAGIVPSSGTGSAQYSGGANNFPRLLEDWSNVTLTLNTSMVCLYNSAMATGQFVLPGHYYYAPNLRQFAFDLNYTQSSKMPPGTPNICRLIRSSWCNPQPNNINYPDVTMSFVPH